MANSILYTCLEVHGYSYKCGCNSVRRVISIATLLITPLITTHEPPSDLCSFEVA